MKSICIICENLFDRADLLPFEDLKNGYIDSGFVCRRHAKVKEFRVRIESYYSLYDYKSTIRATDINEAAQTVADQTGYDREYIKNHCMQEVL